MRFLNASAIDLKAVIQKIQEAVGVSKSTAMLMIHAVIKRTLSSRLRKSYGAS